MPIRVPKINGPLRMRLDTPEIKTSIERRDNELNFLVVETKARKPTEVKLAIEWNIDPADPIASPRQKIYRTDEIVLNPNGLRTNKPIDETTK